MRDVSPLARARAHPCRRIIPALTELLGVICDFSPRAQGADGRASPESYELRKPDRGRPTIRPGRFPSPAYRPERADGEHLTRLLKMTAKTAKSYPPLGRYGVFSVVMGQCGFRSMVS